MKMWRVLAVLVVSLLCGAEGHGRLLQPPSRSSMWRLPHYRDKVPINYDDNALNCGGFYNQWSRQGGKCGACGDPWQGPRKNEPGGVYYTGIISADYTSGDTIDVLVEITANHLGYFEFRLCTDAVEFNGMSQAECLNEHLLQYENGETQYDLGSTLGKVNLRLKLPGGLTCAHCFLQWKWHAGNNWGVAPNGRGCIGCGAQEQFYGCADVSIHSQTGEIPRTVLSLASTAAPIEAPEEDLPIVVDNGEGVQKICKSTGDWAGQAAIDTWCAVNCAKNYCPKSHCHCVFVDSKEPTTVSNVPTTEAPTPLAANITIQPVSNYTTALPSNYTTALPSNYTTALHSNYTTALPSNYTTALPSNYTTVLSSNYTTALPSNYTTASPSNYTTASPSNYTTPPAVNMPTNATTSSSDNATTTDSPTTTTTQSPQSPSTAPPKLQCFAAGAYVGQASMDAWCVANCAQNYCPKSHCQCVVAPKEPTTVNTEAPTTPASKMPANATTSSSTNATTTDSPTTTTTQSPESPSTAPPKLRCFAAGAYVGQASMDAWCVANCAQNYCPKSHCQCVVAPKEPTTVNTEAPTGPPELKCFAAGAYKRVPGLGAWCLAVCGTGNWCPKSHCKCYLV